MFTPRKQAISTVCYSIYYDYIEIHQPKISVLVNNARSVLMHPPHCNHNNERLLLNNQCSNPSALSQRVGLKIYCNLKAFKFFQALEAVHLTLGPFIVE